MSIGINLNGKRIVLGKNGRRGKMISGFPKLFHLGDKTTAGIWEGEVEVTEKVDGSQFNFGVVDGELKMRSKGAEVFLEDDNKMFDHAKTFAKSCFDRGVLGEGTIYHGEYLRVPRHNTLAYTRVPKGNFALYGITRPDGSLVSNYDHLFGVSLILECDVVPLIYRGTMENDKDILYGWLERESYLGGQKIEGFVVKNYAKQLWVGDRLFRLLGAKFVSEQFKEKHVDGWKQSNPSALEQIGAMYKATARWQKMVHKLRDEGKLTNTPKDIGPILKAINTDLEEEEVENIKDMLWKLFAKDIKRIACGGFPEYYKQLLLEESVNEPSS
jgi:hypothetical protein